MATHDEAVEIPVDGGGGRRLRLPGTLVAPAAQVPGVLFVQGWGSGQEQYLARARQVAALGCHCLTFEPRGVARDHPEHETVTREDNLSDVLAAYDLLAGRRPVDRAAIGVVGASYGAYLAAVLASLRPVRWLALRAPALYRDEDWASPKRRLDRDELAAYRRRPLEPEANRALRACAAFAGDVLVVESERDEVVPHPAVANYLAAFGKARSLTYRVIAGADHALSEAAWQDAYTALLVDWATEMVLGARGGAAAAPDARARPGP
jgi:pimeloyl-ACP methyl ester carboxylesterase